MLQAKLAPQRSGGRGSGPPSAPATPSLLVTTASRHPSAALGCPSSVGSSRLKVMSDPKDQPPKSPLGEIPSAPGSVPEAAPSAPGSVPEAVPPVSAGTPPDSLDLPVESVSPSIAMEIKDRWSAMPAVEIELVHEVRSPPYVDKPWRMLEVWTQNRIYGVDAKMCCIEVLDQASQQQVPGHELLGSRLVGGQLREGDTVHLSQPFPRPGTSAVFEQIIKSEARFSHSSTVTRVVLRLHHLTFGARGQLPKWDEIIGWGANHS
jgi:hypothetical protein